MEEDELFKQDQAWISWANMDFSEPKSIVI